MKPVSAAIDWLETQPEVDPRRIGLVGSAWAASTWPGPQPPSRALRCSGLGRGL